ncbi:hypothetical protein CDL15_Pgr006563 [Punica granatum]|uniref:Uncharacterized protein n=1 Tax=Punica granatum TaxID=22663 RepID=A0A218Y114_PUNGR|nr:hypothetical protein CDL15_Pgr006563 [Punica granatum]
MVSKYGRVREKSGRGGWTLLVLLGLLLTEADGWMDGWKYKKGRVGEGAETELARLAEEVMKAWGDLVVCQGSLAEDQGGLRKVSSGHFCGQI